MAIEMTVLYEQVLPREGRSDYFFTGRQHDSAGHPAADEARTTQSRYFGNSAIGVDLLDSGAFWVTNGARRVAVARKMGITHLPAKVTHLSWANRVTTIPVPPPLDADVDRGDDTARKVRLAKSVDCRKFKHVAA
ncbi:MAG: hypothetical protein NTW76_09935 [Corynebacteriales bacterium]|nr:hypothetical protein [Mycobacteriales bacterium]